MTLYTIEETPAKQLFREYVSNACNQAGTAVALELLATENGAEWFAEIMDETAEWCLSQTQHIEPGEVEKKLAELKMSVNEPILFSVPLRQIT